MQMADQFSFCAWLKSGLASQHGGPTVEFALLSPALFIFLIGIIELGHALWIQNALDFSVSAAARCASLNSTACSGQVTTYAASQSGADIDSSIFTYSRGASCGCQVTAAYTLPLSIPWTSLSVSLSADACLAPPPSKSCAA
jgi:Flp pilus assembly protein TadG